MRILILDSTNQSLGFVEGNKVYDVNGNLVTEVPETTTLKAVRDLLLNKKMGVALT